METNPEKQSIDPLHPQGYVPITCGTCGRILVVFKNRRYSILIGYCENCGEGIETAMAFTKEVDEILRRNTLG